MILVTSVVWIEDKKVGWQPGRDRIIYPLLMMFMHGWVIRIAIESVHLFLGGPSRRQPAAKSGQNNLSPRACLDYIVYAYARLG